MGIEVRVYNKKEEWVDFDRPCFGFLSYIDQWDYSDIEDASHDEIADRSDCCSIVGFEADQLVSFDYVEKPFGSRNLSQARVDTLKQQVREALAGLPQYYGDVSVMEESYGRWRINFPLEGKQMQTSVIAAMMLRNVIMYTSIGLAFEELCSEGIEPHVAFVVANGFSYSYNALNNNKSTFYRNHSNDETIFGQSARICDMAAMIKGELPDPWQGNWGDTDGGYGRYGDYDDGHAPNSERTHNRKSLNDLTLLTEGYEESPLLTNDDYGSDDGWGTFTIQRAMMFKNILPELLEASKIGS